MLAVRGTSGCQRPLAEAALLANSLILANADGEPEIVLQHLYRIQQHVDGGNTPDNSDAVVKPGAQNGSTRIELEVNRATQ